MEDLVPIYIKDEKFLVAIADTDATRSVGLGGKKRLGVNKGMLFVFPEPVQMVMIMKDMTFPLDFIFMNDTWEVVHLGSLQPEPDAHIYPPVPCPLVLEVAFGTIQRLGLQRGDVLKPSTDVSTHYTGVKSFKSGGKFELIGEKIYKVKVDDIPIEKDKLQILNSNAEVVANIESGSRIFSREHTKELIKRYKAGDTSALAEFMLHVLDVHDTQEPDYVKKD